MGIKNLWVDYWLGKYYEGRKKEKEIIDIQFIKDAENDKANKFYLFTDTERH